MTSIQSQKTHDRIILSKSKGTLSVCFLALGLFMLGRPDAAAAQEGQPTYSNIVIIDMEWNSNGHSTYELDTDGDGDADTTVTDDAVNSFNSLMYDEWQYHMYTTDLWVNENGQIIFLDQTWIKTKASLTTGGGLFLWATDTAGDAQIQLDWRPFSDGTWESFIPVPGVRIFSGNVIWNGTVLENLDLYLYTYDVDSIGYIVIFDRVAGSVIFQDSGYWETEEFF